VSHVPEASALGIMPSGRVGAVTRSNVYGLLTGCLQDVCFTTFVFHAFVVVLVLTLIFSLSGCFFDQGC
jgi:uncharacterized membrane protein